MSPFKTSAARLVSSDSLSEYAKHLEFEMVEEKRFGFVAGQWLSFRHSTPEGEEITRAYSICSPPAEDNHFALCLNRVQDGFMSNFLCDMNEGDQLRFRDHLATHPSPADARHDLHRNRHRHCSVPFHAPMAFGG